MKVLDINRVYRFISLLEKLKLVRPRVLRIESLNSVMRRITFNVKSPRYK
jgi:hypothetical protein